MERKYTLTAILIAAAMTSVFAGPVELPSKESKAVVQPIEKECTWTGFYVGAHGGYSFGDDLKFQEQAEDEGFGPEDRDNPFNFDQDGFIYGGQMGVNWQINHWLVVGGEAALSGTDISDSKTVSSDGGDEVNRAHFSSDWLVDLKLRVGISFMHNHLLAYATGGPSFTRFHYDNRQVPSPSEHWAGEEGRIGGLAGGGLEYAFNCHWSIRLEWDHYVFDSETVIGNETDPGSSSPHHKRTWFSDVGDRDAIEAGVNFRF